MKNNFETCHNET